MLHNLVIGTANFGMPYGILATGDSLPQSEIKNIIAQAFANNITCFDTAFAYQHAIDSLLRHTQAQCLQNTIEVIVKFNAAEDLDRVYSQLENILKQYNLAYFAAVLIHDPHYLPQVDKKKLATLLDKLLSTGITKKIGLSAYDFDDVKIMHKIFPISLVQCPINPLNKSFLSEAVLDFFRENTI